MARTKWSVRRAPLGEEKLSNDRVSRMSNEELKEELKKRGLPYSSITKGERLRRLQDHIDYNWPDCVLEEPKEVDGVRIEKGSYDFIPEMEKKLRGEGVALPDAGDSDLTSALESSLADFQSEDNDGTIIVNFSRVRCRFMDGRFVDE